VYTVLPHSANLVRKGNSRRLNLFNPMTRCFHPRGYRRA